MWKKDDVPDQSTAPRHESAQSFDRTPSPRAPGERATIGRSITIQGEVTGDEDLLIQGRVNGAVNLKQHSVTVGPEGEVKADITGRVITVEGKVHGNLRAEEQVILRGSALVEGDITAPRVVLDDGARFRGGVDMGESVGRSGQSAGTPRETAGSAPGAGRAAAGSVDVPARAGTDESKGGGRKDTAPDTSARAAR